MFMCTVFLPFETNVNLNLKHGSLCEGALEPSILDTGTGIYHNLILLQWH